MRWALIKNNVVVNVVEQNEQPKIEGQWVLCGDAGPGWTYNGSQFTNPNIQLPTIPQSVTMRQGREVLIEDGLLSGAYTIINAITDPVQKAKALNYFDYSNTMERNNPWVIAIGAQLGLSSAQLDDLFIRAATK